MLSLVNPTSFLGWVVACCETVKWFGYLGVPFGKMSIVAGKAKGTLYLLPI